MEFPLQMGDAFWRACGEPHPSRCSPGVSPVPLILSESPPSSAAILLLWWMEVNHLHSIVCELFLCLNLIKFKLSAIQINYNPNFNDIYKYPPLTFQGLERQAATPDGSARSGETTKRERSELVGSPRAHGKASA
ncbi:hypothetical protein CSV72_13515 [Sporosarcina sp. P20a]|nr:hypothetical protein CSV72_13515 [Sporosarcina sp. P20a]